MQTAPNIIENLRVESPGSGAMSAAPRMSDRFLEAALASREAVRVLSIRASSLQEIPRISPKFVCAILCAIAVILSGCGATQRPRARAFPWANAKNVRPLAPQKLSSEVSNEDLFAELGLNVPGPPSPVAGIPSAPQRPRVAIVAAGGGTGSRVPEVPMIAPQLSPEQTASAQQQTSASISVAEKNIAASQRRSLNPMQSDLASKVRSFLAEAREAAHVGDWTRASNAAKKAEVLSQELAGSL
jgi:hypothetical protein